MITGWLLWLVDYHHCLVILTSWLSPLFDFHHYWIIITVWLSSYFDYNHRLIIILFVYHLCLINHCLNIIIGWLLSLVDYHQYLITQTPREWQGWGGEQMESLLWDIELLFWYFFLIDCSSSISWHWLIWRTGDRFFLSISTKLNFIVEFDKRITFPITHSSMSREHNHNWWNALYFVITKKNRRSWEVVVFSAS